MKYSVRYAVVAVALMSITVPLVDASASPLRSPRHGQEIQSTGADAFDLRRGSMHIAYREGETPLFIQGGDMEVTRGCLEKQRTSGNRIAPGKRGAGHRSNSHLQMRTQLRACITQMLSGG